MVLKRRCGHVHESRSGHRSGGTGWGAGGATASPLFLLGRRLPKCSSMIYAWALEHARLRECFTLRVCLLRVNPYVRIHIIRLRAVQAVHARDS